MENPASLKPTRILPEGYSRIGTFDVKSNSNAVWYQRFVNKILGVAFALLLVRLFIVLRAADDFELALLNSFGIKSYELIAIALVIWVAMILLHEGFHWLAFWLVTGARPSLNVSWKAVFAAAPDWYLPRQQYILVNLAPLAIISLAGIAVAMLIPVNLLLWWIVLISFNLGNALADVWMTVHLLRHSPGILANYFGNAVTLYAPIARLTK